MLEERFKEIDLNNEDYQTLKNSGNFRKVVKSQDTGTLLPSLVP